MSVLELMQGRRTYRRFVQRPVPQDVVADIVEAVRLSSSARNGQPVRLILIEKPADVHRVNTLVKWAAALPPELGTPKDDERPTLFVAVLQDKNCAGELDTSTGIALANMTLAAWEKGVGSCIMQAIDRPALSRMLDLPAHLYLHSMVAFGYPSHKSTVVDVPENGSLSYYLDENREYFVPKLGADVLAKRF